MKKKHVPRKFAKHWMRRSGMKRPLKCSIMQRIADRLRAVSLDNNNHPTDVANRFKVPTSLPLAPAVQSNRHTRGSGPCLLWRGLEKSRHIVPTTLLVRVQCFRKDLNKVVEGPSTSPIFLSMVLSTSKAFDYFRARRDEIRFALDPPPP